MTIAAVFPGQGSQSVGMLTSIYDRYPQIKNTFAEASEALGYDLWALVQGGPEDQLNSTEYAQPAMLVSDVALWRLLNEKKSCEVSVMAGHSLGEYSALVCAGALNFVQTVKLVRLRGRFMQQAVTLGEGAMAAIIGLTANDVADVCEIVSGDGAEGSVSVANLNSPVQTVIAGNTSQVEHAAELAKEKGAKRAVILPVSVPSHCALMQPAAERLEDAMVGIDITTPHIPVLQNVDATAHEDTKTIAENLVKQLYQPVRWVESIERLAQYKVESIIECGPGKVLTGLVKRITKEIPITSVDSIL